MITTRWQGDPDRILVEVADNGSGLREEDLPRVFDPFFTTREVGQGTGLGLSVCYGIVREHGGQITARNAETGGAVFTIELPVMAESLASAAAAAAAAPATVEPSDPRPVVPSPSFAMVAPPEDDARAQHPAPQGAGRGRRGIECGAGAAGAGRRRLRRRKHDAVAARPGDDRADRRTTP